MKLEQKIDKQMMEAKYEVGIHKQFAIGNWGNVYETEQRWNRLAYLAAKAHDHGWRRKRERQAVINFITRFVKWMDKMSHDLFGTEELKKKLMKIQQTVEGIA